MGLKDFIICFLLVFTLSISAIAQKQKYIRFADSLYSAWPEEIRANKYDSLITNIARTSGQENAAMLSHEISVRFYKSNDLPDALKFGLKEAEIYENINLLNETYAQALYQIGFLYERMQNFDSAAFFYRKVIEDDIDPARTARAYCRMGHYYFEIGDFYHALPFYKRGINQLENLKKYRYMIVPCLEMSNVYQRIPDESYRKDRLVLIHRLRMLKETQKFSAKRNAAFHNIIASYYNSGPKSSGEYDFDKAKYHYQQAINYSQSDNNTSNLSTIYSNLGNLYQKEKKDSAIFFLRKSLTLNPERSNEILIHRNLYDYHYDRGQLESALTSIDKSLAINLMVSVDSVNHTDYDRYYYSLDRDEVLSAIVKKVHVLIRLDEKLSNSDSLMLTAVRLVDIADRLITTVQNESTTEDSRLYWRERATDIYSKGILLANAFKNFEKAFYYSEKIKSLLLIENILVKSSKDSLPDEIKSKELALKSRILERQNRLRVNNDEIQRNQIEDSLVYDKIIYQTFLDSIQHIYPEFYANKNNVEILTLKQLQSELTDSAAVVSYVWDIDVANYENLYLLVITKSSCSLQLISTAQGLEQLIDDFKLLVAKPFETQRDKEIFQNKAHKLYLELFPSDEIRNTIEGKRLLILPDHKIHGLPFEALLAAPDSEKFLIEENEISYAYSMSFLLHNEKIDRSPSEKMIAFSPVNFNDGDLATLKMSESEVEVISEIIDGKVLTNQAASKEAFFRESGDYKIIHLATHSQAGSNPWVAFIESKMDIAELYTFKNQAELVVLSACNTSRGEIAEGEGILSLARSFFYSGANAIIATEWNINDKSTAFIFKEFYKNLKNGDSKSAALRKAKINYLDNHSLSDVSPYYWASFTLLGSNKPLQLETTSYNLKWFLVSLLILSSMIFMLFVKNRKKKR